MFVYPEEAKDHVAIAACQVSSRIVSIENGFL